MRSRRWTSTERLAEVAADPFDAVFIPGGHGPMVDLVNYQDLQRLLAAFDREGKMIAAVCHFQNTSRTQRGCKRTCGCTRLVSANTHGLLEPRSLAA